MSDFGDEAMEPVSKVATYISGSLLKDAFKNDFSRQ